jgi:GAF domain-containing protein
MDPGLAAITRGNEFLVLLDHEAQAADFERPLAAARAAGASAAQLAELEPAKLAALRIRDELEQRRRREAELAALFETASDLAALHDLDSVLRAIVHRARLLLGSDVAYMTLNDAARGDTYMRVTAGSVSSYFQQLRLGLGEGLGGLVAERATPYATADYLADERFRHTVTINRGVTDEGLVAILGVPLMLGKRVIGVLFAADRRTRTFSPAEVALLCSMGAHAAVAIDAANLLEEARTAVAELNAAHELVKEHSTAVERTSDAHRRFTELVLAGGNAEDVARAVGAVLGSDVMILGADDECLAVSGDAPLEFGPALVRAVAEARTAHRAFCTGDLWTVAATAGQEHLGCLVLRAGPDRPEADRLILEHAAMVTALLLLLRRSVTEAEHRVRGDLLSDLLSTHHRDTGSLRDRARRIGADLDQPHVLVVADVGQANRARVRTAAAHLAATHHGLAAEHESATVVLLPGTDSGAIAREVAAVLGAAIGRPVTAGAARAGGSPGAIIGAYAEGRRCLDALLALGRRGEAATRGELGFLGLLLSDRKDVPTFLQSAIGPVLGYDAHKGTQLLGTLEAYFEAGGNLTRTKDLLHVHVNTVTQRLDRVTRLIGDGWQAGDRALELRVAIRLYRAGAQHWAGQP